MSELTPQQVAALRKLEERKMEEFRAEHGEGFTRADILKIMKDVNDDKAKRKEKAPASAPSLWTQIGEFFRGPSIRLAYVAGAAAVLILGIFLFLPSRPETIQLAALPDSERTTVIPLPKNLGLDIKNHRLELSEGGDRLSGTIAPLAGDSSAGVAAFTVSLAGKDNTGVEARFRGTLWLTNAAGVGAIRKTADVKGARLGGTFEIVGQSTNAVNQIFAP